MKIPKGNRGGGGIEKKGEGGRSILF